MHDDGKGGRRQPPVAGAEVGSHQTHAREDVESDQPALPRRDREQAALDQYLQERIDGAVLHLRGLLPPDELELLKQQLMEQMCSDPTLRELVQRATGVLPTGCVEKE